MNNMQIDKFLKKALREDIGNGDVTTDSIIDGAHRSSARIAAKEDFVVAGIYFAEKVFKIVDAEIKFKALAKDGDSVKKGQTIALISGRTRSLLKAERTALNLLQRLSGIATLTRRFTDCIDGLPVKILDTRKTTPGLRSFEKYAVRVGGGCNHRFGLFDGILIKDNHISAAGGIRKAVGLVRKNAHHLLKIEVETKNLKEVKTALSAGVDVIMLDNVQIETIRKAVDIIRRQKPGVLIEASGNINLNNVSAVAETGVDMISIGALTHSARAVDISMKISSTR